MPDAEWAVYEAKNWYRLEREYFGRAVTQFPHRIGGQSLRELKFGEGTIRNLKRIPVAPTPRQCAIAVGFKHCNKHMWLYRLADPKIHEDQLREKAHLAERVLGEEWNTTREAWLTKPAEFVLVSKVRLDWDMSGRYMKPKVHRIGEEE